MPFSLAEWQAINNTGVSSVHQGSRYLCAPAAPAITSFEYGEQLKKTCSFFNNIFMTSEPGFMLFEHKSMPSKRYYKAAINERTRSRFRIGLSQW